VIKKKSSAKGRKKRQKERGLAFIRAPRTLNRYVGTDHEKKGSLLRFPGLAALFVKKLKIK
jgi:hypothetical protein